MEPRVWKGLLETVQEQLFREGFAEIHYTRFCSFKLGRLIPNKIFGEHEGDEKQEYYQTETSSYEMA